ncbi:unnamed protein product [Symbiodinium necroappetens]|uniref:Uncharacterized protein n=1 Tax=Symbiodinium necroappetens TaxID=1628268 RepID=A0A813CK93_9DINO|nr:unnamed protein product [Symbiodinium necroappetens]
MWGLFPLRGSFWHLVKLGVEGLRRRQYLAPKWPEFLLDKDCLQVFRRSSGLSDPFVIPQAQAARVLLFSGNCTSAAWERLSEPLLGGAAQEVAALCIPDFTVEPALLLVNTEDLTIKKLSFEVA